MAAALVFYIVGLTIVARTEAQEGIDARRWLALLLPVPVIAAAIAVRPDVVTSWSILAAIPLVLWSAFGARAVLARPPRTVQAVLTWLSGICLVDLFFLALLERPILAGIAAICFVVTAWGHRHVLGT